MIKPGAGEENIRPKLCGLVTECKCSEHFSASLASHPMALPLASVDGGLRRDQVLPITVARPETIRF